MRRSQRAIESPRAADVTAAGNRDGTPERPRLDEPSPSYDEVARRAYQRYEARGCAHGCDQEDWFEAERELRQSVSSSDTDASQGVGRQ